MPLAIAVALVDDPDFAPLFVQDGYAILMQARLTCLPGQDWCLEFGAEFLEGDEQPEQDASLARDNQFSSGNSRHLRCQDALVVEAAVVEGPFRGCLLHYTTLDRVREGLRDLRERMQGELEDALASPDAIFEREYVNSKSARMPSADALLGQLCDDWQHRKEDPSVARFLEMPAPSDAPMLH